MKNIADKIIGNIAFIALLVMFVVGMLTSTCGSKTEKEDNGNAEIERLRKDNEKLLSKAKKMESLMFLKEMEIDSLKSKKSDFVVQSFICRLNRLDRLLREQTSDTLLATTADSLISVGEDIIESLDSSLLDCMRVVELQDTIIRNDSIAYMEHERIIKAQTVTISRLQPTWWDRNKIWIGIVGGLVAGSVGTYAVMR